MKKLLLALLLLASPALAQTQVGPASLTANNAFSGQNTFPTQPTLTNSGLVATTGFTNNSILRADATSPITITGGTYNYASLGSGLQVVVFASGGTVSSIITLASGGSGYAVGDVLYLSGGNTDAVVRITNVSGGIVQSGGVQILYGGTSYTTGAQLTAIQPPIDARNTITLTGTLTSNAQFIGQAGTFLTSSHQFIVNNNTTGAFTVNFCLSNGSDACNGGPTVTVPQGSNNSCATIIQKDGVNGIWLAADPVCSQGQTFVNPTFSGTVTGPDGSVWNVNGLGSLKALGVNETTPGTGDVNVSGGYEVAGSPLAASNLSNGTTGAGAIVLAVSPSLTTPALGTPSSAVLTNATGLPLTTGVAGTLGVANGGTGTTTSTGTGSVVLNTSPTLVTPALGTPSSGVATHLTGLPLTTGVTGTLGVANGGTGTTTSTGTGSVVLSASPSLTGTTSVAALTATSTITPSTTAGIVGTTLGDHANAGSVGEIITATSGAVSMTSGTPANVTSISLTPGDWNVWGACLFLSAGSTVMTEASDGISATSATFPTPPNNAGFLGLTFGAGGNYATPAPMQTFDPTVTTTYFMVAQASFTVSTLTAQCNLVARRVR